MSVYLYILSCVLYKKKKKKTKLNLNLKIISKFWMRRPGEKEIKIKYLKYK